MNIEYHANKFLRQRQMETVAKWKRKGARWTINPHNADKFELIDAAGAVLLQVMSWGEVFESGTFRNAPRVAAPVAPATPQYRGEIVKYLPTGSTHYVNGWGETFCGKYHSTADDVNRTYGDTATCGNCQRAGNAALANGFAVKAGSPATRG